MEGKVYGLVFPQVLYIFITIVEEIGNGRFGIEVEVTGDDVADSQFQVGRPLYPLMFSV